MNIPRKEASKTAAEQLRSRRVAAARTSGAAGGSKRDQRRAASSGRTIKRSETERRGGSRQRRERGGSSKRQGKRRRARRTATRAQRQGTSYRTSWTRTLTRLPHPVQTHLQMHRRSGRENDQSGNAGLKKPGVLVRELFCQATSLGPDCGSHWLKLLRSKIRTRGHRHKLSPFTRQQRRTPLHGRR